MSMTQGLTPRGLGADGLPAGPKGLPLVGTLFDFARDQIGFFEGISRTYGDMSSFKFAGWPCLYLGDSDAIEHVLVRNHKNFIKSRLAFRHFKRFFGEGLLTSDGELWQRQHRLAAPAFTPRRVRSYSDLIVEAAHETLGRWQDGDVVDVLPEMRRLTLRIVARTVLGTDVGPYLDELSDAMDFFMTEVESRLKRPLVIPDHIPLPGNFKYLRAVAIMNKVVGKMIDAHRSGQDAEQGNLLAHFMAARDEAGNPLSDKQLRDDAVILLQAGHETTALALSWSLYLIGQHPDVARRAKQTVDRVLKNRVATFEDLADLKEIEWIILEAMRLYPPVWVIAREAIGPFSIGDCTFAPGTTVLICPWQLHRDARNFEDPAEFRPQRWGEIKLSEMPRYVYMPFGGGPRVCIGQSFAMMEAVLILSTILQRFTVEWQADHPIQPFPSFALRPSGGVWVKLSEAG